MGQKIKDNWQHIVSVMTIIGVMLTALVLFNSNTNRRLDKIENRTKHIKTPEELAEWHVSQHCTITKKGM
jgi:hypothetical protein